MEAAYFDPEVNQNASNKKLYESIRKDIIYSSNVQYKSIVWLNVNETVLAHQEKSSSFKIAHDVIVTQSYLQTVGVSSDSNVWYVKKSPIHWFTNLLVQQGTKIRKSHYN